MVVEVIAIVRKQSPDGGKIVGEKGVFTSVFGVLVFKFLPLVFSVFIFFGCFAEASSKGKEGVVAFPEPGEFEAFRDEGFLW